MEATPQRRTTVYIANRGLIATRVARACRDLGLRVVGAFEESDADALWVRLLDAAVPLPGTGAAAYTAIGEHVQAAISQGAGIVHPGIGFLSESSDFAAAVHAAGLVFAGPSPHALTLFGDKRQTCELAEKLGIAVLSLGVVAAGGGLSSDQLAHLPLIFKSVSGGGGLGLRVVASENEAAAAYQRCVSESSTSFAQAQPVVIAEKFLVDARHIEVQVIGDGTKFVALGTRDCSVQRRFQKLIEIAPAPLLDAATTERLTASAVKLISATSYKGVATVEFLVPRNTGPTTNLGQGFYLLEVNPRLQVEHTVTEQVFDVDLCVAQLRLALDEPLSRILPSPPQAPKGFALQLRINGESILASPSGPVVVASAGIIAALDLPRGQGVRIESHIHTGYSPPPHFDSLLAQIIVHAKTWDGVVSHATRSLAQVRVVGLDTNVALLAAVLQHAAFKSGSLSTRFLDDNIAQLLPPRPPSGPGPVASSIPSALFPPIVSKVLPVNDDATNEAHDEGYVTTPMACVLVSLSVAEGDVVRSGQELAIVTALKMEHVIHAPQSGTGAWKVDSIVPKPGTALTRGQLVLRLGEVSPDGSEGRDKVSLVDEKALAPIQRLAEARRLATEDSARPTKTKRPPGRLTAREIFARTFDSLEPPSYFEMGALALAQTARGKEVRLDTAGDAFLCARGSVNGMRAMVCSYDYTVLAGTQGVMGHRKMDRAFALALQQRLPLIIFAEGGGGRASDFGLGSGLDCHAFTLFAKLRSQVPLVGVVSGFCFAGNATLLGGCDIVVSARTASIGMGGPAMIEGGGLGIVPPEKVGPAPMHWRSNGAVDVLVETDEEAVVVGKRILHYLQMAFASKHGDDQRSCRANPFEAPAGQEKLRTAVPLNRLRSFDVRIVLGLVFDVGSIVELKQHWGPAIVTCLATLGGRPVGLIANDNRFNSGAIDAAAAEKASRFIDLCSTFGLTLISLVDTPGFLVGVEAEKSGLVRRAGDMFASFAKSSAPLAAVILRKSYGLGAMAMTGGSLKEPQLCVGYPTSEYGGMQFEGAVRLGFREVVANDEDMFKLLVAKAYENGSVWRLAQVFEVDDVIDPKDTRAVLMGFVEDVAQQQQQQRRSKL